MKNHSFCCLERPTSWRRKLYLWNVYRLVRGLLKKKVEDCYHFNLELEGRVIPECPLLIFTIAFNNVQVLKYQLKFLKENLRDPYVHVIADNSPGKKQQKVIQELCREYQVGYILLPKNAYLDKRSASYSHGAAATWLYYNYVCRVKPKYFGFLDHDLYPVAPVSVVDKLKEQPLYGSQEWREQIWYIWMGLLFMDFEWVKDKRVNFLPCKVGELYLDTGGSNWYSIIQSLGGADSGLKFPTRIRKPIFIQGKKHRDTVDYIDNCWLHTSNGSNWKKIAAKDDLVERILKDYKQLTPEDIEL